MDNKKLGYRPDVDGLRAIAVLAVIANHLPGKFLASGFLGVDVFFVISGFVVSASLLSQGQTTFTGFYSNFLSRRVKRLMPALLACAAITSAIVFLVDPYPTNSILTGISAVFGVANITLFNFALDYFSPSSKFNAFTHTWSLGVEEQFYIAFPLIIWFTFFARTPRRTGVLTVSIALLSLLSLYFFLHLYKDHQDAAYYLMPMRFWELGVGVLVYLASTTLALPRFSRLVQLLSPVTLIALALCFIMPQQLATLSTPLSVGLTGLLLFNTRHNVTWRLLSLPPVVYVGKISYSLYLWHWPIVSLAPLVLAPSWRHSALYLIAMTVAAVLSFHFIEKPLRAANWSRSKALDIATAFSCSAALSVAAILILKIGKPEYRPSFEALYPPGSLPLLESGLPYDTCAVDEIRPMTPATFDQCTIPPAPGSGMPMIWGMGDSHAGHLQGMLYELHRTAGFGVQLIETPAHIFPDISGHEYPPRQVLFDKALEQMKPGDIVLVSRLYLERTTPVTVGWNFAPWMERVSVLADRLQEKGVTLVLPGPLPEFNFNDVRECDLEEREYCAVSRAELTPVIDAITTRLYALQDAHNNVLVFDTFAQVCPPDAQLCFPDDGARFLFRDRDHLNTLGSARLAQPFLDFLLSSGIAAGN